MKNTIVALIILSIMIIIILNGCTYSSDKNVDTKANTPIENSNAKLPTDTNGELSADNLDPNIKRSPEKLSVQDLYEFDTKTNLYAKELPLAEFASKNLTIKRVMETPQILIFHTHSQETYVDSNPQDPSTTVVGVGEELKKQIEETYGIRVLHCKEKFDMVDGEINRKNCYDRLVPVINKILKDNPTIEVLIDIHRDAVPPDYKNGTVMINDKPTAKISFVNGISKIVEDNITVDISDLPNPYVIDNLTLSYQMKVKGNTLYPNFINKIFIKPYRYSLHMAPKSLFIDVGNNMNTSDEAKNSAEPLATILGAVLEMQ